MVPFQVLFERSPGLLLVLDVEFRIVAVTDAYLAATMTRREAMLGRGIFEVFPDNPDDPHADGVRNLRASLERVRDTREPDTMPVQKYDIRTPGGAFEVRYWSPRNSPVLLEGRLAYVIHRVEDVTEFVKLREQLRTETDRMEAELLSRAVELQRRNVELGRAKNELQLLNEHLEQRVTERTAALERESAERLKAEGRFRQAQKMDAIGQLAGGVAHDFNNLLTVILSCTSLARESLPPEVEAHEDLRDIAQAAERAAGLTRQLLAFSRNQVVTPVQLDLNDVVRDSEAMLKRLVGETIRYATVCSPRLGAVKADRGLLEQVLMNLVVNARDAMSSGGTLTVETANVELDHHHGGYLQAPVGAYVMLAVTDTGTGMDEVTLQRLFEPFFTTKPVGRGTGLGLSMVHGVVKEFGGELIVYSAPGKGTTFKVCLPLCEGAERAATATPLRDEGPPLLGRVLLVEDEARVREVASRILRSAGHTVFTTAAPAEATALASDPGFEFDLLVTDVVMPGMDGPAFVRALQQQLARPIKTLFMSGYTGGALAHQEVISGQAPFLSKPFTPQSLLRKVNEALRS